METIEAKAGEIVQSVMMLQAWGSEFNPQDLCAQMGMISQCWKAEVGRSFGLQNIQLSLFTTPQASERPHMKNKTWMDSVELHLRLSSDAAP